MDRVLRDSYVGVLSRAFTGLDGMPTELGTLPTVTVARLDGTVLTAPTVTAAEGAAGRYVAALTPDHTDQLDILALEWTGTVAGHTVKQRQTVYVCEDMLVTPARLHGEPDMSKHPAWLLTEVANDITDQCEQWCGVAFGMRLEQEVLTWARSGSQRLKWAKVQSIVSVIGDTLTVDPSIYELRASVLVVAGALWPWQSTTVTYLHGQPVPAKLAREALDAARETVLGRGARRPRQVISETVDGTVVRFSTPDPLAGRPTGFLGLDPLLELERVPLGFG